MTQTDEFSEQTIEPESGVSHAYLARLMARVAAVWTLLLCVYGLYALGWRVPAVASEYEAMGGELPRFTAVMLDLDWLPLVLSLPTLVSALLTVWRPRRAFLLATWLLLALTMTSVALLEVALRLAPTMEYIEVAHGGL